MPRVHREGIVTRKEVEALMGYNDIWRSCTTGDDGLVHFIACGRREVQTDEFLACIGYVHVLRVHIALVDQPVTCLKCLANVS